MVAPILVTGGAGFLGSWLVRRLLERGERVRVLDLPGARWSSLPVHQIQTIAGDIRDRPVVLGAVQGCAAVYHLAGLPHLWAQPRGLFADVNYRGAVCVLDAAAQAGCARIVHLSSATVWPLPGRSECRLTDAWGPYSQSKLRAERYALALARRGAPVVVVSPTLPVGPGDWSRTPPTQMILDFCLGKRHEYLDTRLNLIDVRDAAEAMIGALERGVAGQRYLLGHTTLSLLELWTKLASLTGQAVPRRRVPYALALWAGLGAEIWADVVTGRPPVACVTGVRLTRRPLPAVDDSALWRLGVRPKPIEQSLAETVAWFREVGWRRVLPGLHTSLCTSSGREQDVACLAKANSLHG